MQAAPAPVRPNVDKYAGYVIITYAVTLAILAGYLGWMWLKLRALKAQEPHPDQQEGDKL